MNKKQLIKQNRILMFGFLSMFIMFLFISANAYFLSGQPKLIIERDLVQESVLHLGKEGKWVGSYNPSNNELVVSLKSGDVTFTLLHEYGHFVYNKYLNNKEVKEWKEICETAKIGKEEYYSFERCGEHFADEFAMSLLGRGDYEYMQRIIEKYIGGK